MNLSRACATLLALGTMMACSRAPSEPPLPPVRVYVSNEASGDISVIDPATQTVVAIVKVGKRPRGLRVGPTGKTLYVALSGSPNAGPGGYPKTLPPPDRNADGIGEVDLATNQLVRVIHAGNDPE